MTEGDAAIREEGARERSRLVARAGVVGAGTLASRVLGLLRDMVLAAVFDRDATDAWWVAFTIPNALRQLLGEGAVSSAVVPVLSEKLAKEGDEAAKVFFARVRGVSLVALVAVSVLGVVFAGPLTALFAGGYRSRPGELERTTMLTRVVFPYIFFVGSAALGMAALNAKKRFAVAAFAPGLLNVALLAAAFALPGYLVATGRDPVLALAIGAPGSAATCRGRPVAGAAADRVRRQAEPHARRRRAQGLPPPRAAHGRSGDLLRGPRALAALPLGPRHRRPELFLVGDAPLRLPARHLRDGALDGGLAVALDARRATGPAPDELSKTWAHGMCLALFVALPASAALLVLGEPLVVAIFQRGAFDAVAAHETARALFWQGGAIWTVAAVRQIVPAFYALGDTRTPVVVSAIDLTAFIALAIGLKGPFGHVGISIAVAGSSAVQMVFLLVALRWRMGTIEGGTLARSAARTVAASVVAAGAGVGCGPPRHAGRTRRWPGPRDARPLRVRCVHGGLRGRGVANAVSGARGDRRYGAATARAFTRCFMKSVSEKSTNETRVIGAEFVAGAVDASGLPAPTLAEVAFAGRSNVGKSSLLNAMMQRHSLARTSRTPGCTRQINIFEVKCADGLQVRFVDLPGYGWAKRSKSERGEWQGMIEGYLSGRAGLKAVAILVDVRRGPEDEERQLFQFLSQKRPVSEARPLDVIIVATKLDKLVVAQRKPALEALKKTAGPGIVGFSATTGDGREALWGRIRHAVL